MVGYSNYRHLARPSFSKIILFENKRLKFDNFTEKYQAFFLCLLVRSRRRVPISTTAQVSRRSGQFGVRPEKAAEKLRFGGAISINA